jgi:hypothetical protein
MNQFTCDSDAVALARGITGFVTSCLASYGTTTVVLTVLSAYLWWWVAALAALIAGVGVGVIVGAVCATKGVDLARSSFAAAKSIFGRVYTRA